MHEIFSKTQYIPNLETFKFTLKNFPKSCYNFYDFYVKNLLAKRKIESKKSEQKSENSPIFPKLKRYDMMWSSEYMEKLKTYERGDYIACRETELKKEEKDMEESEENFEINPTHFLSFLDLLAPQWTEIGVF